MGTTEAKNKGFDLDCGMDKETPCHFNQVINKILFDLEQEIPPIVKSKQSYGYKYADLHLIMGTLKPLFIKYGLLVKQNLVEGGILETKIIHLETGEEIVSRYSMNTENMKAQDQGAIITYARRYSITCMLNLTFEGEDNDGAGNMQNKKTAIQKKVEKTFLKSDSELKSAMDNPDFYNRIYAADQAAQKQGIQFTCESFLSQFYDGKKTTYDRISQEYIDFRIDNNLH